MSPSALHGVLVVDKPVGPTSHDVVARVRRALGERRIGHTGTLDPFASGVLPLVVGQATRLAQFMSASRKSYVATVRLGISTDTHDLTGQPTGGVLLHAGAEPDPARRRALPAPADVEAALALFRGTFLQQPPLFSAKKVAGVRSYARARQARRDRTADAAALPGAAGTGSPNGGADGPEAPAPVEVTVHALELLAAEPDRLELRMTVSAGFYVRALAHDLGQRLGCGAHLAALRRTAAGDFDERQAVPLSVVEAEGPQAAERLVPMAHLLPHVPLVRLTAAGLDRVRHGAPVEGRDCERDERAPAGAGAPLVRLLAPDGSLAALARPLRVSAPALSSSAGSGAAAAAPAGPWPLHPVIVLT
jgi:tRNA pseudouridine55 synthase